METGGFVTNPPVCFVFVAIIFYLKQESISEALSMGMMVNPYRMSVFLGTIR